MAEEEPEQETGVVGVAFQETSAAGPEFRTWFRGEHTNVNPRIDHIMVVEGPEKSVLQGWLLDGPLIENTTQITAFVSCFASGVSETELLKTWRSECNAAATEVAGEV